MKNKIIQLLVRIKLFCNRIRFFLISIFYPNCIYVGGFAHSRNFGDALNLILIKELSGRIPIPKKYVWPNTYQNKEKYLFIGSVVGEADENTIIYGAGCISEFDIPKMEPKSILAVRGPLTQKQLLENGFHCPSIFGDPALLLPKFYYPKIKEIFKIGIIPHYEDLDNKLISYIIQQDSLLIDITQYGSNWKLFIDKVLACNTIISSSLHGLIIGDAYRKKTLWVKVSDKVIGDDFKFYDYYESIGIKNIKPIDLRSNNYSIDDLINLGTLKETSKLNMNKFLEKNPWRY